MSESTGSRVILEQPRRRRRGWGTAAAVLAAVLVVVVGIGAFAAVRLLSGGGAQPEDAVPADALAFVRLDLDPAASEKIDALQFLGKFDALDDHLPSEDQDLRRWAFEQSAEDDPDLADIDYDQDIAPWLGQRFAVAVFAPPADEEDPLAAGLVQVTDEQAAQEGLTRLNEEDDDDAVFSIRGEWAYFADSQEALDAVMREDAGTLADAEQFQTAMSEVGEESLLVGYVDGDRVGELVVEAAQREAAEEGDPLPEDLEGIVGQAGLSGQTAFGLQFEPSYLELVASVSEAESLPSTDAAESTRLSALPATTLAALQLSGGRQAIETFYDQLLSVEGETGTQIEDGVAEFEAATGLQLPEDVAVLFGDSLVTAVDREGLPEAPQVGIKIRTDAERADEVVTRLLELGREELGPDAIAEIEGRLTRRVEGDLYLLGSSDEYVDQLIQDGSLGDDPRFQEALPDADEAHSALWVDLDAVHELVQDLEGSETEAVATPTAVATAIASAEPAHADDTDADVQLAGHESASEEDLAMQALEVLTGFGLTASIEDSSSASVRVRVTAE